MRFLNSDVLHGCIKCLACLDVNNGDRALIDCAYAHVSVMPGRIFPHIKENLCSFLVASIVSRKHSDVLVDVAPSSCASKEVVVRDCALSYLIHVVAETLLVNLFVPNEDTQAQRLTILVEKVEDQLTDYFLLTWNCGGRSG